MNTIQGGIFGDTLTGRGVIILVITVCLQRHAERLQSPPTVSSHPAPLPICTSVCYGAACVARNGVALVLVHEEQWW